MKTKTIKLLFVFIYALTIHFPLHATSYTLNQTRGSVSVLNGNYVDNMNDVWNINTGTAQLVKLTYRIDTDEWDIVTIFSVDESDNATVIITLRGQQSGTISTIIPNGKARIVFESDCVVSNQEGGYTGFNIDFAVDDTLVVFNNTYVNENSIVNGNSTVNGSSTVNGNSTVNGSTLIGGYLGIGTSFPRTKLYIESGANTDAAILATCTENNSLVVSSLSTQPAGATTFKISHEFFNNRDNGYISFHRGLYDYGGFLEFGTYGLPRLLINAAGNVGIGTISPQYLLDVKGTIRATEIKVVSVSQFADFVFNKDYQLPKLTEVHSYIQTNGHLPNIPSAAEVKENGMSLVDMQVKLLQKIEELTLYVIDQQKEIETLKKALINPKK